MDPISIIIISLLIMLFIPISLVTIFSNKQDCDESRVILPK